MKTLFFRLFCIAAFWAIGIENTWSQNLKENEKLAHRIQEDNINYRYGFGDSDNIAQATERARQDLLMNISSNIKGKIDLKITNSTTSIQNDLTVKAAGQLHGVSTLILANPPQCRVMAYITKAQLDTLYNQRFQRAKQFYIDAQNAEKVGNISDALRFLTWSLCLINSTEVPSSLKFEDKILVNVIPEQIKEILRNLKAEVAEVDGQNVKLFITYKGEPASSVDFVYNHGLGKSDQHTAKDGMASIRLRSDYSENLVHIYYELQYKNETRNDPELAFLMEMYGDIQYTQAHTTADMTDKKNMKAVKAQFVAAAQEEATPTNDFIKRSLAKDYTKTVLEIADAIRQKKYEGVRKYFTDEGFDMFNGLMNYGQAEILTIPELHCFPYREKVICRSIPMRFTYKNNKRVFVEDVTFTFNQDELVENVSFGLDKAMRDQIYTERHLQYWGDSTCTMLATFLENYKTAFALHRLDYIRDIFADGAVIITGHMLKQSTKPHMKDGRQFTVKSAKGNIQYTKMNKEEYMKRLMDCFKRNEFINIHFSDCLMEKMYDDRFGINLRQDYFSSTYSDTGFLFLLVDVSDPTSPTIQYRTWQAERDPDLNNKVSASDPRRGLVTAGMIQ